MLPFVLVLTLSASDPTAVLVTSKRAGAESFATKIAAKVQKAIPGSMDDAKAASLLKKGGLDPRTCQGATDCHARAAKLLGEHAVVIGIDVGKIAKTLAVHLEAVAAGDSQPFGVADFSVPADKWAEQSAEPIATFAKLVQAHAAAAQEKVASSPDIPDKQTQTDLKPASTDTSSSSSSAYVPPPVFEHKTQPATSSGPRVLPFVVGGVTIAALAVCGTFFGLGLGEKSKVDHSVLADGVSTFTQTEFNQHKNAGNLDFTLALSTGLVGAALAVLTVILFVAS